MKAKKVLFITQEITPYVPESEISQAGRLLPQKIQESGCEIRTFMPRWGIINERRNQLHEVIRLSGMNIIIDDTDHPLIIKVASLQPARMQVYFIDNDDYFHKRGMRLDERGEKYADNVERAIFYARGVLETVKKLRWTPDVIHCHGWISSVVPFYLKTAYSEEPSFAEAKVVFSGYADAQDDRLPENFLEALRFRNANEEALKDCGIDFSAPGALEKLAVKFSDGFAEGSATGMEDITAYAKEQGIHVLPYTGTDIKAEDFSAFYDNLSGFSSPE